MIKPVEQREPRASSVSWTSQEHWFKWLFPAPAPSSSPAFGSHGSCPWGLLAAGEQPLLLSHSPTARPSGLYSALFNSTELAGVGKHPTVPSSALWSGFLQELHPRHCCHMEGALQFAIAAFSNQNKTVGAQNFDKHTLILSSSHRPQWLLFYFKYQHCWWISQQSILSADQSRSCTRGFERFLCWWCRRLGIPAPVKQNPHDQSQSTHSPSHSSVPTQKSPFCKNQNGILLGLNYLCEIQPPGSRI